MATISIASSRPKGLIARAAFIARQSLMADVALLGLLALAVRWPDHQLIPIFTDETAEIYQSLLVAQGKLLPLTNATPIAGSLWNYLLAGAFWASGYSLFAPRSLVLIFGVLTVIATYFLGRAWGGRLGGVLAAALMGTAAGHVVVNSHVAWSNCVTPLFTTLAIWFSYRAVRVTRRGPYTAWLLAGLFWGLAFQTHLSVLALLPGMAVFLVWRRRALLRTRWPYLAAGLFALTNLNLLIYNLATGFDSVSTAVDKAANYSRGVETTPESYLDRLGLLGLGLFQALGGAVEYRENEAEFLYDLGLWPIALLAATGVLWQWRRGNRLPGLLLASAVLVLPLFNGKYQPVLNGRYLAPLLPVLYAAIGALFAAAFDYLKRASGQRGQPPALARLGTATLGLAAVLLLLHPLVYLSTYYEQQHRSNRTNAPLLQAVEVISMNRRPEEAVIIDQSLHWRPGRSQGLANAFRLALAVNSVPYRVANLDSSELLDLSIRCRDYLVIVAPFQSRVNQETVTRLDLRDLEHRPAILRSQTSTYGLYRLERLQGAPSC